MIVQDLHYATLTDIASSIRAGTVSPLEIARALLERIERLNPTLHAYYSVFAEETLRDAELAEEEAVAGRFRGLLHGVPVALKDNIECGPTTLGSLVRRDHVASSEATVVTRLRVAGAIVVGKLATYECACGTPYLDWPYPPARNPWNLELDPGGSSSGSGVAVAAGLAYGALGTDAGGSIRIPAAYCGITGLQPSFGLVSRAGIFPLSWTNDAVGPMARTSSDIALLLQAIAGFDAGDPQSVDLPVPDYAATLQMGVRGLRVGIPWGVFEERCDPDILSSFTEAVASIKDLGITASSVELPISMSEVVGNSYVTCTAEAASYYQRELVEHPADFGRELRLYLMLGASLGSASYLRGQRFRQALRLQVLDALGDCDALMLPTIGYLAEPIPRTPQTFPARVGLEPPEMYACIFNMAKLPSIGVPTGFTPAGLPVGLMFASRSYREDVLLRIGNAFESHSLAPVRRPLP